MDIHECCRTGNLIELRRLIRQKGTTIDINERNDHWYNLLYLASENGHLEIVKELIQYGARVNEQCNGGLPLHIAVKNGHLDIVQELILKSTDCVNEIDIYNATPFHDAVYYKHLDIVKALIDYADLSMKPGKDDSVLDIAQTKEIRNFLRDYQPPVDIKEPVDIKKNLDTTKFYKILLLCNNI